MVLLRTLEIKLESNCNQFNEVQSPLDPKGLSSKRMLPCKSVVPIQYLCPCPDRRAPYTDTCRTSKRQASAKSFSRISLRVEIVLHSDLKACTKNFFTTMEALPSPHYSSDETEKALQTSDNTHQGLRDELVENLPPLDGGLNAWLFLAACFVMEALVWGFAFTYGIFQEYYSGIEEFKNSGNIAVVGTCAMVRPIESYFRVSVSNQRNTTNVFRRRGSCTLTYRLCLLRIDSGPSISV